MVDAVFGEMHLPVVGGDWRAELRARSVSGRRRAAASPVGRRADGLAAHPGRRDPAPPRRRARLPSGAGVLAVSGRHRLRPARRPPLRVHACRRSACRSRARPTSPRWVPSCSGRRCVRPTRTSPPSPRAAPCSPVTRSATSSRSALDLVLGALEALRARPQRAGHHAADRPARGERARARRRRLPGRMGRSRARAGRAATAGRRRADDRRRSSRPCAPTSTIAVVGIDIPIGLPDSDDPTGRRACAARPPGRASSVFTTLTRPAYLAGTRVEADAVNRGLSGQGVGAQAFALRAKILEVDAWLRGRAHRRRRRGAPRGVVRDDGRGGPARQAHPRGPGRHGSTRSPRPASPGRRC